MENKLATCLQWGIKHKNSILSVIFGSLGIIELTTGYNDKVVGICFLLIATHYGLRFLWNSYKKLLIFAILPLSFSSCSKEEIQSNPTEIRARKSVEKIDEQHLSVIMNSSQYEKLSQFRDLNICNSRLVEIPDREGVYSAIIDLGPNTQGVFLIGDREAYPAGPLIIKYSPDADYINSSGSDVFSNAGGEFTGTATVMNIEGEVIEIYNGANGQYHPILGNSVRSCVSYFLSQVEIQILMIVDPWATLGAVYSTCILYDHLGWLD